MSAMQSQVYYFIFHSPVCSACFSDDVCCALLKTKNKITKARRNDIKPVSYIILTQTFKLKLLGRSSIEIYEENSSCSFPGKRKDFRNNSG